MTAHAAEPVPAVPPMPERTPKALREAIAQHAPQLLADFDEHWKIDVDMHLPDDMKVRPVRSSDPKGSRLFFDHGHGWLGYTFVRRVEDPQIIVEEIFWQ